TTGTRWRHSPPRSCARAERRRQRVRLTGAAGVERTTRHAPAAPVRLGSIEALHPRHRVPGTGPFAPRRARQPDPLPPAAATEVRAGRRDLTAFGPRASL